MSKKPVQKAYFPQLDVKFKKILDENKKHVLTQAEIRKEKEQTIRDLKEEIVHWKTKLNSYLLMENEEDSEIDNIKTAINNWEIRIIQQKVQQARLDDFYIILERAYRSLTQIMKNAHITLMDAEECNYMSEKIENDKNELLVARNYAKEMQQIGWTNFPPKVADECKKTQIELEYMHKLTRDYKVETEEFVIELRENTVKCKEIEKLYNEKSARSKILEAEIDEILAEIEVILRIINSKQQKAMDLEMIVYDMSEQINIEMERQKKMEKKSEKEKLKLEKAQKDRIKRNIAIDNLTKKQNRLRTKLNRREKVLRGKEKAVKEIQQTNLEHARKVYNITELIDEYDVIQNEIRELQKATVEETKLKLKYFNILEDMMGKLRIVCRCRGGTKDNIAHISDDINLSLTTAKQKYSVKLDYCFGPKSKHQEIFEYVEHFYDMAVEGYNSYIVSLGPKESGKSYLTFGKNEDGLVWLGVEKIKNILKSNSKGGMQTRMFVCSVEMMENKIFDLIGGRLHNNIEIKMDVFKMTLMTQVIYKECFNHDQVKGALREALENRDKAFTSLNSDDTTFVFLVTFQIYNKFVHRYWKGKVTHVKLASFKTMESLNKELRIISSGREMNYKATKLNQLLRDCFGGSSKTCVIGMVNPSESSVQDSIATLDFIRDLKAVGNEIYRNSEPEEVYRLKNDIERLLRGLQQEIL